MINQIIRLSVQNKRAVFFLTLLLFVAGVYSFLKLPIDAVPDITNNQVQVNTEVKGWAAEEIEKMVSFPLESTLRGIPRVKKVRSLSRFGLSQVTVIFEEGVDNYLARQLVTERLQVAREVLPENASPQIGPISTGLGEIYQYVIEFKNPETDSALRFKQLVKLRTIQDWFVKPRLLGVRGVAEVNTTGGYEKQIHVVADPQKLAYYGLHFGDISNTIKNATQNVGGGYVEQSAEQFLIQGVGFFKEKEDILKLPIKNLESLRVVKIQDVASVIEGKESRTGASTYNGNEAVLGTVMLVTGENTRTVAQRVDEKIKEIRGALPQEIEIISLYSRSNLVNETIKTVKNNILAGIILVMMVLFLLVGNFRAALITSVSIPLCLLATLIFMKVFNISGNLMSLGALDFGIIIDGVVIVVDHCMRRIKEKFKGRKKAFTVSEIDEIVIEASVDIRRSAGFGQLIIVIVFLPVFAFTGVEAKMFQPMAITFIIALLSSLVLSFTLVPALLSLFLRKGISEKEPPLMRFLEQKYRWLLSFCVLRPRMVILVSLFCMSGGVVLFIFRGGEFLPQLKEGSYAFHFIRPAHTSLTMSLELQKKAEKLIQKHPQVEKVFSRIGTSEIATDPMGVNVSDTYIILKDFGKGVDFEKFPQKLQEKLEEGLPGMYYIASQPIQMRFNELLEGTRADLSIKVFGDNLEKLAEIGQTIEDLVKPISSGADVEFDEMGEFPVLKIEPKLDALARYGVSKSEVLEVVEIALGGEVAGYFFEKDKRYAIIVRLEENLRNNLEVIRSLPVFSIAGNTTIPLENVASIEFKNTYGVINRENGYRRSAVMVNIRGTDTQSFVKRAKKIVSEKLKLPSGYFIEWGGQYKNMKKALLRLSLLAPITFLLIFLLIHGALRGFSQTLLVFSGIPFALVGGICSLELFGLPLSVSAGVGFIALSGIAVLNGIVLINGFKRFSKENTLTHSDQVIQGASSRLRPVLMTALTDVLGFLPMAISLGIGSEVQRPLAVVIIGGMITSTLLTLFVLPTVYHKIYKHA